MLFRSAVLAEELTLNNQAIVKDASMTAGQKVTWDCVWFGSYPQTEIVDKASTSGCDGKSWSLASDYEVNKDLYKDLQKTVDILETTYDTSTGSLVSDPETPVAGKTATLEVKGLAATDKTLLKYGEDYSVKWYANNGTMWGEAAGTQNDDGTFTVNVKDSDIGYKAVVTFKGKFSSAKEKEFVLGSTSIKQATVTTLTVSQGSAASGAATSITSANEGSEVQLSAAVKDGSDTNASDVTEGMVIYYADGKAIGTFYVGDKATYTMPALSGEKKSVSFSAKYIGTTTYAESSAAASSVEVSSITIVDGGVKLSSDPALKAGTESTLAITGIVKNSAGVTLSSDSYTVAYYENKGDGKWTKLESATVKPADSDCTYKAVISPAGSYTKGEFEAGPIGDVAKADLTGTNSVKREPASGSMYQNKTYTFCAAFPGAAGGTVSFYCDGRYVENVPLVNEKAYCDITFREAKASCEIKAVYSGSSLYNSATASTTEAVLSTELGKTLTLSGTLSLDTDCSLTCTVANGTNTAALTENTDYILIWQVNDGSGWAEFKRGGTTASVKPTSKNYSYRVIMLPAGEYTTPANGIVSNILTTSDASLLATATSLTVDNSAPFEDREITLTAVPKQGTKIISGGTVKFTVPDEEDSTKTKEVLVPVDAAGTATLTLSAPAYTGKEVTYKAAYQGDGVLYAADAAGASVKVQSRSVEIVRDPDAATANAILDANGNVYTAEPDVKATLKLPKIYEKGVKDAAASAAAEPASLTYGTDYLIDWYVCTDGSSWSSLGSGAAMEVTPAAVTDQYKAIVTPIGDYKKPIEGLTFVSTKGKLAATTTTLEKTSPTGDVYVGNEVTVTAKVTYAKNSSTSAAADAGTVYFIDADTGAQLGVKELGTDGTAAYKFKVTSSDTVNIRAEYSGTGKYAPSETTSDLKITPKAPVLTTYGASTRGGSDKTAGTNLFVISGDLDGDGNMKVGETYTLKLPKVVDQNTLPQTAGGSDPTELTANKNYTVKWMSRGEDGSWSEISAADPNEIKVTPSHDKAAYTAVIYPKYNASESSYYVEPRNGFAMETVSVGTKLSSTTSLTTDAKVTGTAPKQANEAFEGTTVKLTAEVKNGSNKINGGSVTFKKDGVEIGTVAVVDGKATLDVKMPAYDSTDSASNKYKYTAEFSGTSAYDASKDATGKTITVRSSTLTVKDDAVITIKDENDKDVKLDEVVVGKKYTLEAPLVYATDDLDTALKLGTDYTLEWQVSLDGNTWQTVTGSDGTQDSVTFANVNAAYRVIVRPAAGSDYTMPSSIPILLTPQTTAQDTTTTLSANKAVTKEGEEIILTAKVAAQMILLNLRQAL